MNVSHAVIGGLIGGGALIAVLYPAIWMMPRQMKMNFLLIVGSMVAPIGATAYAAGLMIHAMMSVVFGLIHGSLLEAAGVHSVGMGIGYGALFGLVHAIIVGMMLGMMPMVHPRMRSGRMKLIPALAGAAPAQDEELLDPPGFFGLNYPLMTVMGFFMLHIMFGIIVGVVYGALA